ncbi:hypothetical protein BDV93DRAFT_299966 [Ceratobasidium sp. AG-I]|nr:hypothetical protein BDV93DRAFT_299966 [Ceratobasidium sp. AG-I]
MRTYISILLAAGSPVDHIQCSVCLRTGKHKQGTLGSPKCTIPGPCIDSHSNSMGNQGVWKRKRENKRLCIGVIN